MARVGREGDEALAKDLAAWTRAQAEREAQWRQAFLQASLDCIIVIDGRGLVVEFNPQAQETFGFTREEAVGQELAQLIIPPEYRDRHRAGMSRFFAVGEGPLLNRRIEIEGVRKDGRRVPVELAITPFRMGGDTYFAGYLRDISHRLEAQRALEQRAATIHVLQQLPVAALQATGVREAVAVCLEQICLYAGWKLGHAYIRDESGEQMVSSGVWFPASGAWFTSFRQRTEQTTLRPGQGMPGQVWLRRQPQFAPDFNVPGRFPRSTAALEAGLVSAIAFPVIVHGRVEAVLEFFSDRPNEPDPEILDVLANVGIQLGRVFERRRAEGELERANARLRAETQARVRMLNVAAHELGTPLTPMVVQVELLKLRHANDDKDRKSLEVLERNLNRLRDLVQDLLDAARLDSGRLRVRLAPVDLAEAAARAVNAYREVAREAGLHLQLEATGQPWALADDRRLGQVLDNLLSNAVKFTPRGGSIHVRVREEGGEAVADVTDTGPGLSQEQLERLFQPFSQVHGPQEGQPKGSGLGLYISRGFVEACGGSLEVTSEGKGTGATFRVRLPATRPGARIEVRQAQAPGLAEPGDRPAGIA